mmetsp:Transcript_55017/g.80308  ORF Transcript_55017/g.80308 Transcript_55017/m.80308 type:complete len:340 (-) Transcript_55017:200-1219(-)
MMLAFNPRISCRRTLAQLSNLRLRKHASTLVVVDHGSGNVLESTKSAVTAAKELGQTITALVCGSGSSGVADQAAKIEGVSKVLHMDNPCFENWTAESVTDAVVAAKESGDYSHIVTSSLKQNQNYLGRIGAKLDVSPISDVLKIFDASTFQRPMYAGNAVAKVTSSDAVKVLSIRPTVFEAAGEAAAAAPVEALPAPPPGDGPAARFLGRSESRSDRPDLGSAKVVVAGGRALKDSAGFELLYALADRLGGAVGASRAAVDAGMCPSELQVGQTGKVVAPDLYLAVGISGAIQHVAGMKDSKVIVAVNKDKEAPIFQIADYGLVGDLFKIIPELQEKL